MVFKLMDPKLRQKMSQAKVWWSRFQIPSDHNIHRISIKLKNAGLISSYFVDKLHVTNVQRGPDSPPRPVKCVKDFISMFTSSSLATQLIHRHTRIPIVVGTGAPALENAPREPAVDSSTAAPTATPAATATVTPTEPPAATPIVGTSSDLSEELEMDTASISSPPVSKPGGNIVNAE